MIAVRNILVFAILLTGLILLVFSPELLASPNKEIIERPVEEAAGQEQKESNKPLGKSVRAVTLRLDSAVDMEVVNIAESPKWTTSIANRFSSGSALVGTHTGSIIKNLLKISDITVEGNYHLKDDEVIKATGLSGNPWIWQAPLGGRVAGVENHPWISSAYVNWQFFPLTGKVFVEEEEPWIVAELGGKSWLVARSGKILQPLSSLTDADLIVKSSELPRLDGIENSTAGSVSLTSGSKRLVEGVKQVQYIELAGSFPFEVDRYSLQTEEPGMLVSPRNTRKYPKLLVNASTFSEARTAVSNLRAALKDLKSRKENPRLIDLRFRGQVVVKKWDKH